MLCSLVSKNNVCLTDASELAKAIQTLGAHVEETRTPAGESVYLKIRSRHSPAGIILCRVRVSFHPATERARSQALFQVGNHEGADVTLETWADILPRVASLLHVSGAKEEAEQVRRLEAVKHKVVSPAFRDVLANIQGKRTKKQTQCTEKLSERCKALSWWREAVSTQPLTPKVRNAIEMRVAKELSLPLAAFFVDASGKIVVLAHSVSRIEQCFSKKSKKKR